MNSLWSKCEIMEEIMKIAPWRLYPSPREPPSFTALCLKHGLEFFSIIWDKVATEAVIL